MRLKQPLPMMPRNFECAADIYLDWYKAEHSDKPTTWRRVEVSFVALTNAFGTRPLKLLGPRELEEFKRARRRNVKPVTIRHDLHALSGLFQFGMRQGWCVENPVRQITVPSDRDAVRIRVVTAAEETRYLAAAKRHPVLSSVARLMLGTGMRPGEVLALRAGDYDGRRIVVRQGKTPAARRAIRLTGETEAVVEKLVDGCAKRDSLFPYSKLNGAHNRACERAGLRFCLYDLRHTFATRMAGKGMPLTTLAAILGHSSLRCVMRYVHPQQVIMDEAMERYG
jgi:integrase